MSESGEETKTTEQGQSTCSDGLYPSNCSIDRKLLFHVKSENGNEYKLYLDGKIEGFGDGATVSNFALPFFHKLHSQSIGEIKLPTSNSSDK